MDPTTTKSKRSDGMGIQMVRKDGGRDGEEAVRQTQRLREREREGANPTSPLEKKARGEGGGGGGSGGLGELCHILQVGHFPAFYVMQ